MQETRTIFFVGKPGCGKGTQARMLCEKTGWPVFGAGKLFRQIASEDTAIGRKLKMENDAGYLQPHWFAMHLYLKSLFSIKEGQSVIFDGFNRKVPEAELVIASLKWLGRSYQVVNIAVSDEQILKRVAERGETDARADDHQVDKRLSEYREYTVAAIELFRNEGTLLEVNGEQSPEAVAADVRKVLHIE